MKLEILFTFLSTLALRHEEEISNRFESIIAGYGNDLLKPIESPYSECEMMCPRKVIFENCLVEEIQ